MTAGSHNLRSPAQSSAQLCSADSEFDSAPYIILSLPFCTSHFNLRLMMRTRSALLCRATRAGGRARGKLCSLVRREPLSKSPSFAPLFLAAWFSSFSGQRPTNIFPSLLPDRLCRFRASAHSAPPMISGCGVEIGAAKGFSFHTLKCSKDVTQNVKISFPLKGTRTRIYLVRKFVLRNLEKEIWLIKGLPITRL